MARATSAESAERVDHLQGMILAGEPNTACLQYARQKWGVSRAQGYKLVKRAWAQIKDDIDETGIDRQELLSWAIQTLITASGQALKQKNPGAVVACIRQLDHMTGTGYNSHRGLGIRRRNALANQFTSELRGGFTSPTGRRAETNLQPQHKTAPPATPVAANSPTTQTPPTPG